MPPPVHELGARPTATPDAAPRAPTAAEEGRRTFLRLVSHELRTPLNSVIGFSEIIASELYGPIGDRRYADHARLVHESGLRLLKLVNDVLDIARLEAGAMDLDLRPEPPLVAVEEAVRSVRAEAKTRNVRILFEAAADGPAVVADHRALQRVFENLLRHALAQSPEGGAITIRSQPRGDRVDVEIADRGRGITEEELGRILRPFEQGEESLARAGEQAPLGLTIVRLLCRAMGGEFAVASAPGEGMTATVSFPRAPAAG